MKRLNTAEAINKLRKAAESGCPSIPDAIDLGIAVSDSLKDALPSGDTAETADAAADAMLYTIDASLADNTKLRRSVLAAARSVVGRIDRMPISDNFKNKVYLPKRKEISRMLEAEGIPGYTRDAVQKRTRRRKVARYSILAIFAICLTGAVGYWVWQQHARLNVILADPDEDALISYISDPANVLYTDNAMRAYMAYMDHIFTTPGLMDESAQNPPLVRMYGISKDESLPADFRNTLCGIVKSRSDSLYAISLRSNDIESWTHYQSLVPPSFYYDSAERIDSIEIANWSSESTAWLSAKQQDSRDSYQRYLDMYPDGVHAQNANSRLVDLEVNNYRNHGKGVPEQIEKVADTDSPGSRIVIHNNSEYTITILLSGRTSRKMTVAPDAYEETDISDGEYKVLAEVDNPAHDRFSFTQNFSHGIYASTITIR